ncbi:tetratricopeptide repeat protein [Arcicella lustrica]|uniref:Tetratricopeptide repeat protein n=1 Tax=Arcicella lustrica TaxID=2984196 RepID=A0ABU5SEW7_9BACT|nr:hypothetical protein [Arcicella sp. DC25W]MEA5425801.1 hypothetical protein [Arcicella sp. DC25W]
MTQIPPNHIDKIQLWLRKYSSKKIHLTFWMTFLLITTSGKASDFEMNSAMQKAYSEILKMKIANGRSILAHDKSVNGVNIYLNSYADLIELMITEDKFLYEKFINHQDERIDLIENLDKKSPYFRFLLAELHLHSAFVKLKFGHETKGSWEIIKAYKLLDANAKEFPNFLPNQKSLGLLHILIGSTPENYQWVIKLIGLKGNIKLGLSELQNVIHKDSVFKEEAQFLDYVVHAYILKFNPKKLNEFQQFISQHQDNLLFQFFGVTTFMKEGKSEIAFNILENRPESNEYLSFPFLEYLKADILLQKGQYQLASKGFQSFLAHYKGFNFVKDTYYKIFLSYWLNNEDAKGRVFLEKVKLVGENIVEADKAATKFAENFLALNPKKPISQKVLMKARLACDGGFYDKALMILEKYSESNFEQIQDRMEFNYRKGRIFQLSNNILQAIPFYERAIVLSAQQIVSFGASSALQLGYIYQAKGEKLKAKSYFEKAISYKKHEYKNSIDNKAKAALNELGY